MQILGIRENPNFLESGVRLFDMAFGGEATLPFYHDLVFRSIDTPSPLPRFFVGLEDGKLIAGCGLVTNDFLSRMDLWPWLCSLYVLPEYRGGKLGAQMMDHALREAKKLGFPKVYLSSALDDYYEKYNWVRIEDAYDLLDGPCKVYERATAP